MKQLHKPAGTKEKGAIVYSQLRFSKKEECKIKEAHQKTEDHCK